jgi:hypothetical protein
VLLIAEKTQRRQLLEDLLADGRPELAVCPHTRDRQEAASWMADTAAGGVEGVVIKGLDVPYRPGRTRWWKCKTRSSAEAIVGGVTGPLAAPTGLLVGRFDPVGRLRYVGRTGPLAAPPRVELSALVAGQLWSPGGRRILGLSRCPRCGWTGSPLQPRRWRTRRSVLSSLWSSLPLAQWNTAGTATA